ncbi:MAG TPA: flagellin [Solirubrobacteraceae bacterium]|nr:flagellin [Solirubrobacteraceae bacterium]
MSLTINTNVAALEAQRYLQNTESRLSTTMEQLSSGLRINIAANDVAGYAISQELEGQINGSNQAVHNVQDGVALSQTAQGALNTTEEILQRIRTLAVQYKNGTNSEEAKKAIEGEVTQLVSQVEKIGEVTKFNGVALLKEAGSITFQVGANKGEEISVTLKSLKTEVGTISLGEETAITNISTAIKKVAEMASEFGSVQDRMQYTAANLEVYSQNLSAANSAVKDANMAESTAAFAQEQILQQSGVAVLAQANALPQAVLKLV